MPSENQTTVVLADRFAAVAWTPADVLEKAASMGIVMTEQEALRFLERNQKYIRDDMIVRGWDSIETLLELEKPKE